MPEDISKSDKGKLLFLTYVTMRFELEEFAQNPSQAAATILSMKHKMTIEKGIASIEQDPSGPITCAMLEPLAVGILIGCPDLALFASPATMLQQIAVFGRNWLSENKLTEEQRLEGEALITEVMEWIEAVEEIIGERKRTGEPVDFNEITSLFSEEFQENQRNFNEKMKADGIKTPSDIFKKMAEDIQLDQMMATLDPDDIN